MQLKLKNFVFIISVVQLANVIPTADSTLGLFKDSFESLLNLNLLKNKNRECNLTSLLCRCGNTRKSITITVPQCKVVHRWKARCRPCDKMTAENICPLFQFCDLCTAEAGDRCARCPKNRYGDWCEKECKCRNGAECDKHGHCICSPGYEGESCEIEKGCPIPSRIRSPLEADFRPPEAPTTIIYRCPAQYELKGIQVSTCLTDGQWSSPPPKCLAKCSLLSAPANGRLKYNGSELVSGITAEISCDENFRISGDSVLRCMRNGSWSGELPRCVELAFCNDPGDIQYGKRTIKSDAAHRASYFYQEDQIRFTCDKGFEKMGPSSIMCLFDGTWSHDPPTCVKVATVQLDCYTTGAEVVDDEGVPVRILCPPECANKQSDVWGTSIYRMNSAVCSSAVHAGKITNSGGHVAIINNGAYTNFAGSLINNIQSENYEGRDESFRFDKLPSPSENYKEGECPDGLELLDRTCVHISSSPLDLDKAEALCKNLGLQLKIPKSTNDKKSLIMKLQNSGKDWLWTEQSTIEEDAFVFDRRDLTYFNDTTPERKCKAASIDMMKIVEQYVKCDLYLNFVCVRIPASKILASCTDPGPVENGKAKHVGKINGLFYVGSSVEYSCDSLHYVQGATKISCTANGTWSEDKPKCIRVDTCSEPPVPIGGYVNYLPPLDTRMAQRNALRHPNRGGPPRRVARIPVGLEAMPPPEVTSTTTSTPEPEIELPPGQRKVGTRAMYDCESRYYTLVGSRTRRCEGKDQWSGRPPTCMPICGRSDSPRMPFIVNGNATDIGQWPWQIGLSRYLPDYDQWFLMCGGALLTERWVVTAAHCVTYTGTTLPADPDKFRVYLGKYHRSDTKDDDYVQVKKIHEMHIHPDYDPGIFDADIALIQLDSPVQLNSRVQPVCLPTEQTSRENLKPGSKGVVTGWGMNENESYSDTLQQAVLPIISNEDCEKGYEEAELPLSVTDNMFCAGFKEGKKDTCSGDSGGPMVFVDDTFKERKWTLEGLVSWGSPNGCGHPNQYGGFTSVSRFLNWIHMFF